MAVLEVFMVTLYLKKLHHSRRLKNLLSS